MKVAEYDHMRIAVFTRDRQCPPHVHVDGKDNKWTARFKFSFWHNGVEFWDSTDYLSPEQIDEIAATIKLALPSARNAWKRVVNKVCLDGHYWNEIKQIVESRENMTHGHAKQILRGTYDAARRLTILHVAGVGELGIQL
jgi:hypothetical protein